MEAANKQAEAAEHAADVAQTGYKYLTSGAGAPATNAYINAGTNALTGAGGVTSTNNAIAQLLGVAPTQPLWNNSATAAAAPAANTAAATPTATAAPANTGYNTDGSFGRGTFATSYNGRSTGINNGAPAILTPPPSTIQASNVPAATAATPGATAGANAATTAAPGATTGDATGTAATATPGNTAPDAFQGYLGSTGYNFQLGQGMNAINSNAAAKGLLNSGGSAKALEQYGQNLASTTFNNYLTQLSGLSGLQSNTANAGQNMLSNVASAGTAAGQGAAQMIAAGGNAQAGGIAALGNTVGNALGSAFNTIGGYNGNSGSNLNTFPGGGGVNYTGGLY